MKKVVRLNETDLRKMITEAVKRIINESKSSVYDYVVGRDLLENVLWDYVPEGLSYAEGRKKIDGMIKQLINDPAVNELYHKEYTIWGESYYEPQSYYNDESYDFEITDDDGLEETIEKVKNDDLRGALYKAYEGTIKSLRFDNNYTEEMQDYANAERAESDYDW